MRSFLQMGKRCEKGTEKDPFSEETEAVISNEISLFERIGFFFWAYI